MRTTRTGKWEKYTIMKRENKLRSYLPNTILVKRSSFWSMVSKYKRIMLKPCNGFNGKGVIQVSKKGTCYEIRHELRKTNVQGKNKASLYLKRKIKNKRYIAQRYIDLSKINGKPFDIRVMVLKGKNNTWKVQGQYAKIAIKGYVVTNNAEQILPTETALLKSQLNNKRRLLQGINRIALLTARQLERYYPNQQLFGLDIGIDRHGRMWIIEANTKPTLLPFLLLGDRKTYRKLLSCK